MRIDAQTAMDYVLSHPLLGGTKIIVYLPTCQKTIVADNLTAVWPVNRWRSLLRRSELHAKDCESLLLLK